MRTPGTTFSDDNPLEPTGLGKWTSAELKAEIERREKIAKEKRDTELKAREIQVTCPQCKGMGTMTQRDWQSGYDESVKCSMCNGDRSIIAYKA